MIDAFKPEPQIGSPMFVFTDATPKDATASNIDLLKWYVLGTIYPSSSRSAKSGINYNEVLFELSKNRFCKK